MKPRRRMMVQLPDELELVVEKAAAADYLNYADIIRLAIKEWAQRRKQQAAADTGRKRVAAT
jgi:Arc/MetJ-type ribon-helix-helix transcriptional regulator